MTLATVMMVAGAALILYGLWRYVRADLGAERRGRRAVRQLLAEIAVKHPTARADALAALDVASLPGDPPLDELLKGPG